MRYGIEDPQLLLPRDPRKESTDGIDAALYARQEKRRLVDLGGVLMERQRAIDEANEEAKVHAAASGARRVRLQVSRPNSAAPILASAQLASGGSSVAASPGEADRKDPVIQQAERWITEEKKRTKSELISLVEEEARKQVLREQEVQRQMELAAAAVRARIEEDAERRKRIQDSRMKREQRAEKLFGEIGKNIEDKRQKHQKAMDDHKARTEARASLAAEELKRRERAQADHAKAIAMRVQAQREAAESSVKAKHERAEAELQARMQAREAARWTPQGKVVPFIEGPKGAKVLAVQRREAELRAAKVRAFEEKFERERIRAEERAQLRNMGIALRREASQRRMEAFRQSKEIMNQTEEDFKQSTMTRIKDSSKSVDALHESTAKLINDRRTLSIARDKEKIKCIERVDRARQFTAMVTKKEGNERTARAEALREKRRLVVSASRERVAEVHYVSEHLKDNLASSPMASLKTLRNNAGLLAKLGVNVGELELAEKTLTTSMSMPAIRSRPGTAPSSAAPRKANRAAAHVMHD